MRIRPNGNENEIVTEAMSAYYNLLEPWIYFSNMSDENKLYRIHLESRKVEKILDQQVWDLHVAEDGIFFSNWSDEQRLYFVQTDGNGLKKLSSEGVWGIHRMGDWVYYKDNSNLWHRVKNDGSQHEVLP